MTSTSNNQHLSRGPAPRENAKGRYPLAGINEGLWVIIDGDSGTVVGTNLKAVAWTNISEEVQIKLLMNESFARDYATRHGRPLYL